MECSPIIYELVETLKSPNKLSTLPFWLALDEISDPVHINNFIFFF